MNKPLKKEKNPLILQGNELWNTYLGYFSNGFDQEQNEGASAVFWNNYEALVELSQEQQASGKHTSKSANLATAPAIDLIQIFRKHWTSPLNLASYKKVQTAKRKQHKPKFLAAFIFVISWFVMLPVGAIYWLMFSTEQGLNIIGVAVFLGIITLFLSVPKAMQNMRLREGSLELFDFAMNPRQIQYTKYNDDNERIDVCIPYRNITWVEKGKRGLILQGESSKIIWEGEEQQGSHRVFIPKEIDDYDHMLAFLTEVTLYNAGEPVVA